MLVATRVLRLAGQEEARVVVRLFAPEQEEKDWSCRYEIEWPDETWKGTSVGIDGIDSMHLALKRIGADLYTSTAHKSGELFWLQPGQGYGATSVDELLEQSVSLSLAEDDALALRDGSGFFPRRP